MSERVPRLRMFAGPNGSGKSTLRDIVPEKYLGVYVNPDDLERESKASGCIDFPALGINSQPEEVLDFFRRSTLLAKANLLAAVESFSFSDGRLLLSVGVMNAYIASVAADFIRTRLIARQRSLSFETVMSSPDKIDLMKSAQRQGYRTYLYYIATDDPDINVKRVGVRVQLGGHDVPEEKIRERYVRSLDLLIHAIKASNRAYIFDNSGNESVWLAEITDGQDLITKEIAFPRWFKRYVLDKITV